MPATIFDTDLEQDVWDALRGITVAEEAEGEPEVPRGESSLDEADAGRSIEAYRPPLPELPVRASEDEDAEDELLVTWPYPQPGDGDFGKAGRA